MNRVRGDYKRTAQQSIEGDPIVAPLVKSHPSLMTALLTGDENVITTTLMDIPEDQVPAPDRNYVRSFATALIGAVDASKPGTKVGVRS